MRRYFNVNIYLGIFVLLLFSFAFFRIHLRIQTTIIGYDLAKLKEQETHLLEERSYLNMQYSKLVTKTNLEKISKTKKEL